MSDQNENYQTGGGQSAALAALAQAGVGGLAGLGGAGGGQETAGMVI